jgi:Kef-type K+ transport system membrane component KefB
LFIAFSKTFIRKREMQGTEHQFICMIIMTGVLLILTMLVKLLFERIDLPPIVGFLLLGFGIRTAESQWHFLTAQAEEILVFFAEIGVVTLLFRAGLESDLKGMLSQLRRASLVWTADVLISGLFGFVSAYSLLKLELATSLFVGTAFTATSIGVSVAVWQKHNAIATDNGELLLDIAELDDISAIILMALLLSLVPLLQSNQEIDVMSVVAGTTAVFFGKLMLFTLVCYLFASFGEHPLVRFFRRLEPPPLAVLVVIGVSLIIAGLAGLLGFSTAIGAFFAGLVFSRDPDAVKMEAAFLPIYQFFSPFFFIGIGLDISPKGLEEVLSMGIVFFAVAAGGKVVANFLPVWIMKGFPAGILIGLSMVPRAEISMIIMHHGLQLGEWAVPQKVFDAMALVTLLSCSVSPLAVNLLLRKWPQKGGARH